MARKNASSLPFSIFLLLLILTSVLAASIARRKPTTKKAASLGIQLTCTECAIIVAPLKWIPLESAYFRVASTICAIVAQKKEVCDGFQAQFDATFAYIWPQLTVAQVCGLFMDECDTSGQDWSIILPKKPHILPPIPPAPRALERVRILQLSDLHIDWNYAEGAEVNCAMPQCCRGSSGGAVNSPAGRWGTTAEKCDLPYRTLVHALEHIAKSHSVDLAILTGDYVDHASWLYTKESHLATFRNISDTIQKYLPGVPVHWVLGNHDSIPINSFAPSWAPRELTPHGWLYGEVDYISKRWTPPSQATDLDMITRGSFVTVLRPKLILVSVNSGYCERTNFIVRLNQTDPDGTLSWLADRLFDAERNGQRVLLAAHIPPGDAECLEGWAKNYYRITQRFHRTIVAHLFGHVHTDSFTMFYSDMENSTSHPVSVGYVAPSLTTYGAVNPSYRIVELDADEDLQSYEVVDVVNYYANLSAIAPGGEPQWKRLYSMRDAYGIPRFTPDRLHQLAEKITRNSTLQDQFVRNAYRSEFACTGDCRRDLLCSIFAAHHSSALCSRL